MRQQNLCLILMLCMAMSAWADGYSYHATVSATGVPSVTVKRTGRSSFRLTATPVEGYEFVRWEDGSTEPVREVSGAGAASYDYRAVFSCTSNIYRSSLSYADPAITPGTVSASFCACEWTLTATPADGYTFSRWSDGNTDNPRIVSPAELTERQEEFTAEFSEVWCNAFRAHTKGSGGAVNAVRCNCSWTLTAVADEDNGYAFSGWSDGVMDNPRTVAIDRTVNIHTFAAKFERPDCNYRSKLTYDEPDNIHGTVSAVKNNCTCEWTLTATPADGYKFSRWSDGNTSNPRTVSTDDLDSRRMSYTAEFVDIRCELFRSHVSNPAKGGTVNVARGACQCEWVLTATPAEGYRFAGWSNGNTDNPYTFTIDRTSTPHTYKATFAPAEGRIEGWRSDAVVVATNSMDLGSLNATVLTDGTKRTTGQSLTPVDAGVWSIPATLNAYAGQSLRLALYDACGQLVTVIDTVVPYVSATNANYSALTMPGNTDIAVVGGTLTFDADNASIGYLDIYPNAKAVVPAGKELTVTHICMRADGLQKTYPQLVANGSITNTNSDTIYYDYTLNYSDYYPLAVPYAVSCSNIRTKHGKAASYEVQWYNGEDRAANASGWTVLDDQAAGATLQPGTGYIVFAVPYKWNGTRHATVDVRFPMVADLSSAEAEKTTSVSLYGGSYTNASNRNWNFLGNPYLANYTTGGDAMLMTGTYDPGTSTPDTEQYSYTDNAVRYITTSTDGFRTYSQSRADAGVTVQSFNTLFIQAASTGTLTFARTRRDQNAPARTAQHPQGATNEVAFGIVLRSTAGEDRTGMLYGEPFTGAYEMNADLVKLSGSTYMLEFYSLAGNDKRAFNALPLSQMHLPVPLGIANAPTGEMTIAFDAAQYDATALAAVMLTDYETGRVVNLLEEDYMFTNHAATNNTRFAIHAIKAPEVATPLEELQPDAAEEDGQGVDGVYDILGRRVSTDRMPRGVYIIIENGVSRKEVIR